MLTKLIVISTYFEILLLIGVFSYKKISHFKLRNYLYRSVAVTALSVFVVIYVSTQIEVLGKTFELPLNINYFIGAIASINTGFLCVPFFKFVVQKMDAIRPHFEKLDVLAPLFLMAMIAGFIVTKIYPRTKQQLLTD